MCAQINIPRLVRHRVVFDDVPQMTTAQDGIREKRSDSSWGITVFAPAFHRISTYRTARKNPIASTHRNRVCRVPHVSNVVGGWLKIPRYGRHSFRHINGVWNIREMEGVGVVQPSARQATRMSPRGHQKLFQEEMQARRQGNAR